MPLDVCTREIECGAAELFGMDPEVVSVGIIRMPGGYGFGVRRYRENSVTPLRRGDLRAIESIRGIAVRVYELPAPIRPLLELASAAANGPLPPSIPEQDRQRPLRPGLQLQNWDEDARAGVLASGRMTVGTLGMLLERGEGKLLISNNHVLAGQNRGCFGDRITQPGGIRIVESEVIARLERFVPLHASPLGARPQRGTVIWNQVDAAVARLSRRIDCAPGFLDLHAVPSPTGVAGPVIGERVFKVGRTTGLRWGTIVSVGERVGRVPYAIGECWFRGSFVIEGDDGLPFSDSGDSGAIVVRRTGEVVGMVYAGSGTETFACPITDVLAQLGL
ncbi:MAG TPA: hypothetical protein VK034_04215 [Enhygromyxa sp.]|nr:hypothetical protein [Enhygromyxa sp.]